MPHLEKLREVNPDARGYQELFQWGDDYVVVSTVSEVSPSDPVDNAIVQVVGLIGGFATSGEETMAFTSDSNGVIQDWTELAVATGEGSRQQVLEMLQSGTPNGRNEL